LTNKSIARYPEHFGGAHQQFLERAGSRLTKGAASDAPGETANTMINVMQTLENLAVIEFT
jgi:hypothetical protein